MRAIHCLILAVLITTFACSATNDITSSGGQASNRIIRPFGDSITYGFGFASLCYQWPAAATGGGYRGWMTAMALTPPGIGFYFSTVGNQDMGSNVQQFGSASALHDGYPGWRTDQLQGIAEIKLRLEPTQTLIHAGTNDIAQGVKPQTAWDNLKIVLQNLRKNNPNTKLVVAQIIRMSDIPEHQDFNTKIDQFNGLIGTNVSEHTFPNSSVVPMGTKGFLENSDYIADGVHPACTGYVKMACKWITAIGGTAPSSCSSPATLCKAAPNPPACNTTRPNLRKGFTKRMLRVKR